uniref:Variant surface glycoprotein 1921 n=1 Tax=Trypanosoma brucei TaxID=5691 RepID=M4SZN4_9TRYP|nr:variant surface glycoprotein 1921 [Trypanosoma brucei]
MQTLKPQVTTAIAIQTVLAVLIVIPIENAMAATAPKGALHHTNLAKLCDIKANVANTADRIKDKLEEVQAAVKKEKTIKQTAFVAAGNFKQPNATVTFATSLIATKVDKVTQTLLTAAEQAETAALSAGLAEWAVQEVFSVLEQLTKVTGASSSAQSVCLIKDGNSIKKTNPGNLGKCFTLAGGDAGTAADPFSVKDKLSAKLTGDGLFTSAAAGSAGTGCPLTNIDTNSFGKNCADIAALNLAGGII